MTNMKINKQKERKDNLIFIALTLFLTTCLLLGISIGTLIGNS